MLSIYFLQIKLCRSLLLHLKGRSVTHVARVLRNHVVHILYETYVKRVVENNAVILGR